MYYLLKISISLFLLLATFQANANPATLAFGRLFFGNEETVIPIQELPETNYNLCFKYTSHSYLAGLYVTDDGYVLQEKGNKFSYLPLDETKIAEFQRNKILPDPLPKYSLPISAYIFGYSLWWSILILAAILFFSFRSPRKKE